MSPSEKVPQFPHSAGLAGGDSGRERPSFPSGSLPLRLQEGFLHHVLAHQVRLLRPRDLPKAIRDPPCSEFPGSAGRRLCPLGWDHLSRRHRPSSRAPPVKARVDAKGQGCKGRPASDNPRFVPVLQRLWSSAHWVLSGSQRKPLPGPFPGQGVVIRRGSEEQLAGELQLPLGKQHPAGPGRRSDGRAGVRGYFRHKAAVENERPAAGCEPPGNPRISLPAANL